MTHAGEKRRPGLGHVQRGAPCLFQLLIGFEQARVGGLQFGGAGRDDVLQFAQVLGEAVLRFATLLDLHGYAGQLLVGDVDQDADFVALMTARAGQSVAVRGVQVAPAERTNNLDQRLGQHEIEQHQQDQREQQAAGEAGQQGEHGAPQEVTAERIGVDFQAQQAEGFIGRVTDEQLCFELTPFAEEEIAEQPVAICAGRAADPGQGHVAVVYDLCTNHRR